MSLVVSKANRRDNVALDEIPKGSFLPLGQGEINNLYFGSGYAGKEEGGEMNDFKPHICSRGEMKKIIGEKDHSLKIRYWMVEVAISWSTRLRKFTLRYEKTDLSYNALSTSLAALIVLNRIMGIVSSTYLWS